ncbi:MULTISPECIES: hypothetical protein [Photorhabdus]|uniref:Photorhabdus luminescens subsp. laumondii TTO1 complete genome segment 10/17 n=1 Tax=Photorhabdus laumondii subsp. laumondii (strain DSM 15139 / CIP 105565 / TT01) TaxID=243265 RepID=Q7N2W7_PHOLL|nr:MULTISPECIES: hypothetical protein [Photorhabdus]AWK42665.1 hypothetical protein A4R40_14770 [Photorhabdus laumondii subsp. laumondii]KTL62662.1 hypothetical protein AA106_19760 [Photorhabdus laumondii subsp. laumondii]CAE15331.1 unnamed protein product [Photorhabdus laumondii subsp. laumondii TTO1]
MSAKNDFKAFAIVSNANVPSQPFYEASTDLLKGFPDKQVIDNYILNKALRQASTISSVVADFIATESNSDVLDDGNVAKLTTQLNKALEQKIKVESDNRFIRLNTNTKTSGCILSKTANVFDDQSLRDLSLSGFLRPNGWADLGGLAIHVAHPSAGIQHSRGISFEYGSTSGGQEGFGIHTYAFDKDGKFKGKKRILTEDDRNKAILSVNGWWRCGDTGMIYQWGNVPIGDNQGKIVNLPILFPNELLSLHVTAISSAPNNNTDVTSAYGKPLNKSQIHISVSSNYNNNGISGVYFFVIGY